MQMASHPCWRVCYNTSYTGEVLMAVNLFMKPPELFLRPFKALIVFDVWPSNLSLIWKWQLFSQLFGWICSSDVFTTHLASDRLPRTNQAQAVQTEVTQIPVHSLRRKAIFDPTNQPEKKNRCLLSEGIMGGHKIHAYAEFEQNLVFGEHRETF